MTATRRQARRRRGGRPDTPSWPRSSSLPSRAPRGAGAPARRSRASLRPRSLRSADSAPRSASLAASPGGLAPLVERREVLLLAVARELSRSARSASSATRSWSAASRPRPASAVCAGAQDELLAGERRVPQAQERRHALLRAQRLASRVAPARTRRAPRCACSHWRSTSSSPSAEADADRQRRLGRGIGDRRVGGGDTPRSRPRAGHAEASARPALALGSRCLRISLEPRLRVPFDLRRARSTISRVTGTAAPRGIRGPRLGLAHRAGEPG